MTNERLIEEAAKAIADLQNFAAPGSFERRQARAALAVFEKAHTPTDDEREVLTEIRALAESHRIQGHDGFRPDHMEQAERLTHWGNVLEDALRRANPEPSA